MRLDEIFKDKAFSVVKQLFLHSTLAVKRLYWRHTCQGIGNLH